MLAYFNGLILGLSLIIALGPQNIFLIKQGIRRNHAFLSAIICFCCDLILISLSMTGLHQLLLVRPILQVWLLLFGCLFLLGYALKTLKKVFLPQTPPTENTLPPSNQWQIILLALGFSLLNPHAIIDTLVIIGGGSSQYPDQQLPFFLGIVTSSLLWFSALILTAYYFSDVLAKNKVWKGIECLSSLLMTAISMKLGIACWRLIALL